MAVLLLLQRRGRVTAAEVAAELEVSERTARRDLEALGMAGVPVYATRGRGGGWRLAGGGRTDLSGLHAAEVRALFLVAGTSAAATPEVRAALRKLVRALPEELRDRAEAAAAALVVDPVGWERSGGARRSTPPLLEAVQAAVVDRERVRLGYVDRRGETSTRTVDPLGVVAKGSTWYLVAGTDAGRRTFRVDRITAVEPTGEVARRPADFDLAGAWAEITDRVDELRAPVRGHGRVDPTMLGALRHVLGTRLAVGPTTGDGWVAVEVRGHSVPALAGELAGFAAALVVEGPDELRRELAAIGALLVGRYARRASAAPA